MNVHKLLDMLYPHEYGHVELSVQSLHNCATPLVLDELSERTHVHAYLDRQCSCVRFYGRPEEVIAATDMLRQMAVNHEATHVSIEVDRTLIKELVMRKGALLKELQKETESEVRFTILVNL
jgi:hypothetical protein